MMEGIEEKYESLRRYCRRLESGMEDLKGENRSLRDQLMSAEHKIQHELVPRIDVENKSYDHVASTGFGDQCFANGDSGKCGEECSVYGSKPECMG